MPYDVSNFDQDVIQRSFQIPVLVDFWASWCAPCRVLGPILERLEAKSENAWVLAKLNTENHEDIALKFKITSIPSVKLFHEGKMIEGFAGALPEFEVTQWLKKYLPNKHSNKIQSARRHLSENRQSEAEHLLRDILNEDPKHQEARSLLASIQVFDRPEETIRLTMDIDEPVVMQLADAVRTIARLLLLSETGSALPATPVKESYVAAIAGLRSRNFEEALQHFIRVIRDDRYYDDDGARKACIAIFKFLGEDHPITQRYRREFSSALYI